MNPISTCGADVETTEHFLLRCLCFSTQRTELFNTLYNHDSSFSKLNSKDKVAYLLHVSTSNSNSLNKNITEHVNKFLKSMGRFNEWQCYLTSEKEIILVFLVSLWSLFCKFNTAFFNFLILTQYYYLYLATSINWIIPNQFCFSWFHFQLFYSYLLQLVATRYK